MNIKKWTGRVVKTNIRVDKLKYDGGVDMSNFESFDLNNFIMSKSPIIISSKEALKDVTPIEWNSDVVSGRKKILVDSNKKR